MAIAMIDGPAVRVQLERLGLSITDFAAYARMERADVSRALHGHPQQPSTLFRIAQALDELQRERARAVRGSMSSPAAALAGTRAGGGSPVGSATSTERRTLPPVRPLPPPLDDKAGLFVGEAAEAYHDMQFAVIRDPALLDRARREMGAAMARIIARHTATPSTQKAARRRT